MDDFLIFHHDKYYLAECLIKIKYQLNNIYYLNVNKNKIVNAKEGFVFLGYHFKIRNKKTIIKLRKETWNKVQKRIKDSNDLYNKKQITFSKYFSSINNYRFTFKYSNNHKITKYIERNY